jgi:hypothetical protein
MKLVREYINEKFVADSDPIHDMGIGEYYGQHKTFSEENEFYDWLIRMIPKILNTDKIPKDLLTYPNKTGKHINDKYMYDILKYIIKYANIQYNERSWKYGIWTEGLYKHIKNKKIIN